MRLRHLEPAPVGLEPPFEHEGGLPLLGRNEPDDVLVQTARHGFGFNVRHEAPLVLAVDQALDALTHGVDSAASSRCRPKLGGTTQATKVPRRPGNGLPGTFAVALCSCAKS